MTRSLSIEVLDVTQNKEEGGNEIKVRIYDDQGRGSVTVLHPAVIAELEWGDDRRFITLPMGSLHARRVTEALRKIGWPTAGQVLNPDQREKYLKH